MSSLLIAVAIVIIVSGFCSLLEAALYALPDSFIEQLCEQNRASGKLLKALKNNVDRPITAVLSLNTIANTAGASVAGAIAANHFNEQQLIAFSAAFTLGILIFSEVLPKTIGVLYAKPLAGLIALPLTMLVTIFRPLIAVIGIITRLIPSPNPEDAATSAEIATIARLGHQAGTLDETEVNVIQNILALESKTVSEILTPRMVVFRLDGATTVQEAVRQKELMMHSRIPVVGQDPDDIIGIAYRRDILREQADGDPEKTVIELAQPPQFIRDSKTLDVALNTAMTSKNHLFVVVDEYAGFSGVVTLEDILEEILGQEIVDETDEVADLQEIAKQKRREILQNTPTVGI